MTCLKFPPLRATHSPSDTKDNQTFLQPKQTLPIFLSNVAAFRAEHKSPPCSSNKIFICSLMLLVNGESSAAPLTSKMLAQMRNCCSQGLNLVGGVSNFTFNALNHKCNFGVFSYCVFCIFCRNLHFWFFSLARKGMRLFRNFFLTWSLSIRSKTQ